MDRADHESQEKLWSWIERWQDFVGVEGLGPWPATDRGRIISEFQQVTVSLYQAGLIPLDCLGESIFVLASLACLRCYEGEDAVGRKRFKRDMKRWVRAVGEAKKAMDGLQASPVSGVPRLISLVLDVGPKLREIENLSRDLSAFGPLEGSDLDISRDYLLASIEHAFRVTATSEPTDAETIRVATELCRRAQVSGSKTLFEGVLANRKKGNCEGSSRYYRAFTDRYRNET
ncbi:MAG: hypothetical protein E6Q97_20810 [Desulfurellales bacterium]|nr:MAG: hypothetical protein E6Q97_20810 [Desulfurellales bacterium]